MSGARDFEDDARDFGDAAVRQAIDAAAWAHPAFDAPQPEDGAPEDGAPEDRAPPDGDACPAPPAITATPFIWRDEAAIPPRKWLYGRHLLRKFISLDVAAGGIGKSSVKVVEALALASGRPLLRKAVHEGPTRVWLYNLEDPDEETERRIHAAARYCGLAPDDVGDRLFVNSGRDRPVVIAEETPNGARIVRPVSDALIAAIRERQIDVLILDPFVSAHAVSENDNGAIDVVAKEFARIADLCDCSINLVHHVRKQNGAEVTAESSRGAVSLIGAARSVIVYNRMTAEEAAEAGVPPEMAGFHFRTANDKANLSPPERAVWHRMNDVELANGDRVGVACPWDWPDAFAGVSTDKLRRVQQAVAQGAWRLDVRAQNWVGTVVAGILGMDPAKDRKRLTRIVHEWLRTGALVETEREDAKRMKRAFVEVGQWVID